MMKSEFDVMESETDGYGKQNTAEFRTGMAVSFDSWLYRSRHTVDNRTLPAEL